MFKLKPSKIRSRRQTFTTEKRLILPLAQGMPDRDEYAELLQGYEMGDNYRIRKMEGYQKRNANPNQIKIEPWKDRWVVFSEDVGDSIKIEVYNAGLTSVVETVGSFTASPFNRERKECPKQDCDGFEFGKYFVFQVGGESYLYSSDTYFNRFEYQTEPANTIIPGNYIRGVESGAKAQVQFTKYYNVSSVVLGQYEGEFIEGEQVEHYKFEEVEKQVISANIPEVVDGSGNVIQAAYDEFDISYVNEAVVISTHNISYTYKDEDSYVLYIDLGAIESGGSVVSTSGTVNTQRVSDNIDHKSISNNYGIFESDSDILNSSSIITSHNVNILSTAKHWVRMSWAPQGYVLKPLESGQVTRMLVGDVVEANGEPVTNGESIVYYSEAYRENEQIPFLRWKDDSFSKTGTGGWVAHPTDGRTKDIITINDGFIALREKGLQEYSFNYYTSGDSSQQKLNTTYFRNTSPYSAVSTPEGEFYVSEDGLYRMNLGNASGEYDVNLAEALGRRFKDYDFTSSVMFYRKGKLHITFKHCTDIGCGNNAVLIYDIGMKAFSYALEWDFNDISGDKAVGDTGGFELFQGNYYGNNIGLGNEAGMPTRFLSKEFRTDRQFYIDGYWIKWIGGDDSDLTVEVKGRVNGCVEVVKSDILTADNDSDGYFNNPTCSDNLGCEEYKYVKIICSKKLTSVMFDIKSSDSDPHEIVELGIKYTLHKKDYGC